MLSEILLSNDQEDAISRLYEHNATILVAATGVGKTVICQTAIKELQGNFVTKAIVAAPAKVVENSVWFNEAAKWGHLCHLKVCELKGDAVARTELLKQDADVIVVSLNNLDWLLQQDHGADGIIVDELSKAAGKQTAKLKSKKYGGCFKWRVGMTATPVSQNFEKLYPMCRIIDGGAALGTNKSKYLSNYFYSDYMGYNWTLKDGAEVEITKKIASLVYLVDDNKAETLPELTETLIRFDMPATTREVYNEMKKHMVVGDVEAANEAVKSGKLRQIASGFLYRTEDVHSIELLDTARYDAMRSWIRALDGRPGLIFYEFVQQASWGVVSNPDNIRFAQINSMSHGVDGLQHVFADLLFIQPMWSRDAYEQAIGRVWRQGQEKPVSVTTLVCNDTLDDLVINRVDDRGEWMKLFKQHLKGE